MKLELNRLGVCFSMIRKRETDGRSDSSSRHSGFGSNRTVVGSTPPLSLEPLPPISSPLFFNRELVEISRERKDQRVREGSRERKKGKEKSCSRRRRIRWGPWARSLLPTSPPNKFKRYQAQLQKNLLYLAAIADAQPQAPAMRPQMIPHAAVSQGGGQYMQQAPMFPPKTPLQFTQQQQQQQLHHQPQMMPFQGHMGVRPAGLMNGMHAAAATHTESSHGGASNEVPSGGSGVYEAPRGSSPSSSVDGQGSKQDAGNAASEHATTAADSQKNSTEQGSSDAEPPSNPKRPEDSKTP